MDESPNRMLEFLTGAVRAEGEASRGNRRLACKAGVALSYPSPAGWRTIGGRLRDISRAGAGLVVARPVPAGIARVRLTDGEGTPWLEVEIIGVDAERPRRHRVRLRFPESCPSFFLRLAVLGPAAADDEAAEDASAARPANPWAAWVQPTSSDDIAVDRGRWAC